MTIFRSRLNAACRVLGVAAGIGFLLCAAANFEAQAHLLGRSDLRQPAPARVAEVHVKGRSFFVGPAYGSWLNWTGHLALPMLIGFFLSVAGETYTREGSRK